MSIQLKKMYAILHCIFYMTFDKFYRKLLSMQERIFRNFYSRGLTFFMVGGGAKHPCVPKKNSETIDFTDPTPLLNTPLYR